MKSGCIKKWYAEVGTLVRANELIIDVETTGLINQSPRELTSTLLQVEVTEDAFIAQKTQFLDSG